MARELGASFAGVEAAYFARWITPTRLARRYDARFFFAVAARDAEPRPTPEHVSALQYLPPAEYYRGDPEARLAERHGKLERARQRREDINRQRLEAAA